jgi:murein L,D-transpeptidase YafK
VKSLTLWLVFALFASAAAYAHWPDKPLPVETTIDSVLVLKAERKLVLLSAGTPVKQYRVALGGTPLGQKTQEGDEKTPEGLYIIDYRKVDSSFHRALHISYPNDADRTQALARGVDPGGIIMIHGIRNGAGLIGRWHRLIDWTNGCIAVTNAEIEELWNLVPDGTPIEIRA